MGLHQSKLKKMQEKLDAVQKKVVMKTFRKNTLKDVDYEYLKEKKLIIVEPDDEDIIRITDMIERDAKFFAYNGLMDYSLLLAIE